MHSVRNYLSALMLCFVANACGSAEWNPPPSSEDVGDEDVRVDVLEPDVAVDTSVTPIDDAILFFGVNDVEDTQSILNDGETIELTSGFQGGWHLDLITKHPVEYSPNLNGTQIVKIVVDGITYHESSLTLDERGFEMEGDLAAQRLFPLILEITSLDDVLSKTATMSVTYSFDDGVVLTRQMTLVIVDERIW